MTQTTVSTRAHQFWDEGWTPTTTREVSSTLRDDETFLDIEIPLPDEISDVVFSGRPTCNHVTIERAGGRWPGDLVDVTFSARPQSSVLVLTYRNSNVKTEAQNLLEVLR